MTTDTTLVKRGALYKGEIGLFPTNEMASDDLALFPHDEVMVSLRSERNLQQLKFVWALATKIADNSDRYLDKDEAMADLKLRAAHTKMVYDDKTKMLELRPKSLRRMSHDAMSRLIHKMLDVVTAEILPTMKRTDLTKQIEDMIGGPLWQQTQK